MRQLREGQVSDPQGKSPQVTDLIDYWDTKKMGWGDRRALSWRHPAIARNAGPDKSLAMGGGSFHGTYWRLTESSYPREYMKDERRFELIDTAVAVRCVIPLPLAAADQTAFGDDEHHYLRLDNPRFDPRCTGPRYSSDRPSPRSMPVDGRAHSRA
ncbi:hypothetical protein [Streptomyces sp. NPDC088141]|uniref:hypothetical protein n=1 Tax=unclassified Streptomyces TaxID=2593676 RepID=UPI00343B4AA4